MNFYELKRHLQIQQWQLMVAITNCKSWKKRNPKYSSKTIQFDYEINEKELLESEKKLQEVDEQLKKLEALECFK